MARLGFILGSSPLESPGARTFYHLALGALDGGHEVWAYCHRDGVYQAVRHQRFPDSEADNGSPSNWWAALLVRGVRLTVSELCAQSRGIDSPDILMEGVAMGGADALAELISRCDKVVCL